MTIRGTTPMLKALKALFAGTSSREDEFVRRKMALDHADPRKRFAFGVLAINYQLDPGYRVVHSEAGLRDWYGITQREQLIERMQRYLAGSGATPAYDAFRTVFLARAGAAAGLLSVEESWQFAIAAARCAQQAYDGWMAYGLGYLEANLEYRQQQGDDAERLQSRKRSVMAQMNDCAKGIWSETPFSTPLGE